MIPIRIVIPGPMSSNASFRAYHARKWSAISASASAARAFGHIDDRHRDAEWIQDHRAFADHHLEGRLDDAASFGFQRRDRGDDIIDAIGDIDASRDIRDVVQYDLG